MRSSRQRGRPAGAAEPAGRREKELQEEIRKSEEASRNNQTAVGGFIWPTACRLITGGYGGRDAPCPGASTYHLGVDIGASWGSDIYATKAGTVSWPTKAGTMAWAIA